MKFNKHFIIIFSVVSYSVSSLLGSAPERKTHADDSFSNVLVVSTLPSSQGLKAHQNPQAGLTDPVSRPTQHHAEVVYGVDRFSEALESGSPLEPHGQVAERRENPASGEKLRVMCNILMLSTIMEDGVLFVPEKDIDFISKTLKEFPELYSHWLGLAEEHNVDPRARNEIKRAFDKRP